MPLAGTPLINYTIEFLMLNKVKILTIFAFEHQKAISAFIESLGVVDIEIRLVKWEDKPSVTSVLKDLDKMGKFKNDILMINSHIVTNLDISEALEAHNLRKKKDTPMLMTKIFIKCPLKSKIRDTKDLITIVSDGNDTPSKNQIFKYESMANQKCCKVNEYFEFKRKKHPCINVRMGLLDWDIDIINPSLISILEDFSNFDHFKDDFINHITENEIIVDKIFMHEIEGISYFSRVNNPQNYFQTCMDVIQRLSFPICPGANVDSNSLIEYENLIFNQQENCNFGGMNEKLGSCCFGMDWSIGTNTTVEDSCISPKTNIDENCSIVESVIWRNVSIGANWVIKNCIVTNNVTIPANSELINQLIIDANGKQTSQDISFIYRNADKEGDESEESDLIEDESDDEQANAAGVSFEDEVKAVVRRQLDEGHSIEFARVEINSLKFSNNKSFADCIFSVVPELIESVLEQQDLKIQDIIGRLDKLLSEYSEILKTFIISANEESCLIECIEKCWIDHVKLHSGFHLLLQIVWKAKLLPNEALIKWSETQIEDSHELRKKFIELSAKFIQHLKSLEDDSSEGEEEESESD